MRELFKRNWIRLRHWEFWPMEITYLPVVAYYLWLSFRARSLGFFAAVNPGIPYGGMRGEPKYELLRKLPQRYWPRTLFVPAGTQKEQLLRDFEASGIGFPAIGKPDVGERGYGIQILENPQDLLHYAAVMGDFDFMVQAYIPYDTEYSIFHYRYPGAEKGEIISICKKGFLQLVGDGESSLAELTERSHRAYLQKERLAAKYGDDFHRIVPGKGEIVQLGRIGNHSLGTEFINAMEEYSPELLAVFDGIESQLQGIHLARYDLRCRSMEEMKRGEHIYIVEINGAGAEMAHIYDTRMGFGQRYREMLRLWGIMFRIAKANRRRGHPYMSWRELKAWKRKMDVYYPKLFAAQGRL